MDMKRAMLFIMVAAVACAVAGSAFGVWGDKDAAPAVAGQPEASAEPVENAVAEPAAEPEAQKPIVRSPEELKRIAQMKEKAAEKRAEIDGTVWDVTVVPAANKAAGTPDVITFAEGKISSKNLAGLGYEATSFTLKVEDDDRVMWETMQLSDADGTTFFVGNIAGEVISGVMSKRDKKDNPSDYSFTGKMRPRVPVAPVPAEETAAPAVADETGEAE